MVKTQNFLTEGFFDFSISRQIPISCLELNHSRFLSISFPIQHSLSIVSVGVT